MRIIGFSAAASLCGGVGHGDAADVLRWTGPRRGTCCAAVSARVDVVGALAVGECVTVTFVKSTGEAGEVDRLVHVEQTSAAATPLTAPARDPGGRAASGVVRGRDNLGCLASTSCETPSRCYDLRGAARTAWAAPTTGRRVVSMGTYAPALLWGTRTSSSSFGSPVRCASTTWRAASAFGGAAHTRGFQP